MNITTDTAPVTTIYKMLWRSMRVLRRFTVADLMSTVPVAVSREEVQRFVGWVVLLGHVGFAAGTKSEDENPSFVLIDNGKDCLNVPMEALVVEMVPRLDSLVVALFRFRADWQKVCDGKVKPPAGKGFEDSRACYDLSEAFRAFIGEGP